MIKTSLSTVNGLSTFLELIRIISKYTATTLEVVMTYDMGSVAALEFYLSDNYIFLFIKKRNSVCNGYDDNNMILNPDNKAGEWLWQATWQCVAKSTSESNSGNEVD